MAVEIDGIETRTPEDFERERAAIVPGPVQRVPREYRHRPKKFAKKEERQVFQIHKDDTKATMYHSIKQASVATGVAASSISLCCYGLRNHAGGFKWKFVKEVS